MPGDISCSVLDSVHRRRLIEDVRERLLSVPPADAGHDGVRMRVTLDGVTTAWSSVDELVSELGDLVPTPGGTAADAAEDEGTRRLSGPALRIHVDPGPPALAGQRWRVLNAAAPSLTALFGSDPDRRNRGQDPVLLGQRDDAAAELTDFALDADWTLGPAHRPTGPFLDALLRGEVTLEDWHRHLGTLAPAVRPGTGYEVRCMDALPSRWLAAPLVLITGILAGDEAMDRALGITGPPDADRLRRAAEAGLGDPEVAAVATDLFRGALDVCRAQSLASRSLPTARAFFERYTARARTPRADDPDLDADSPRIYHPDDGPTGRRGASPAPPGRTLLGASNAHLRIQVPRVPRGLRVL